ncbi:MAG TPA: hydroxyisourate hydrolase [Spirochaetia bacterium]|nr:hydroxyisourate hydrolase [Spirochaetia bacterium]
MGRLTTHVLDTARGVPASGMQIELFRGADTGARIASVATNSEGRTDAPLLEGGSLTPGAYQLLFHVGEYFRRRGDNDAGRFLENVPVVFVVDDPAGKYHVPLLVSPWSYSTYRGS